MNRDDNYYSYKLQLQQQQQHKSRQSHILQKAEIQRILISGHSIFNPANLEAKQGSSSKCWRFPIIFLQRLGLATSNLASSWSLPSPIIKSHAKERVGMALG